MGFTLGDKSTIQDCTASGNQGDGIRVSSTCQVIGNNSSNNGSGNTGTNGDGIRTTGNNNRIDGNHAIKNRGYGIRSSGPTADFIMRNTAFENTGTAGANATVNYSPSSGAYFGPLGSPGAATSPWANMQ